MTTLLATYLQHYPTTIIEQVETLFAENKVATYLLKKYPQAHQIRDNQQLYDYTQALKNRYLKQSKPITKVMYDDKTTTLHRALGLHTTISRVQGSQLRAKKELRIASVFKQAPEAFLQMIVVHELAHLREQDHNKAFYQLCQYMQPDYHQVKLDLRIYLTYLDSSNATPLWH